MKNFLQVNRALAAEKNLNYFNLNQIKSNPDGLPTVKRLSRLMSLSGKKAEKEQLSPSCPRDAFETLSTCPRYILRIALIFSMFVLSIGQMWGTDFDITLDQFRTTPISGLVKIDDSNLSLSGGALQLSSGNKDFIVSTTNSNYKIKEIVFTTSKAVISYGGDAISENTFTPASPGTSFTLNLAASGGTAKITQMVVTLTTSTSETLEALLATAITDGVYTTGSSVITLSTEGGTCNTTSGQEYINLAKSKSTRSLTIATSSSYNIKFIALAFYDAIFSRTITASTGTYTAASYIWTPGATPSNSVTLTFNTENSEGAKIRRVLVGYESAGGDPEPECGSTAQAALTLSSNSGTICGTGTTTFTVSGGSGTGALSVSSSDETKATASISGSTVTVTGVDAGSATITVTKACDATYAEKTATYSATVAAVPTAAAGADKTTEPGTGVTLAATAAASGCTGAWTIVSGPNTATSQLSSTTSATATFTPTVAGTYTLRWTVTNSTSGCSAYDDMTVTAAVCSISSCGNATLTYAIYTSGDLTTSNLFSGATSSNATAVSVGSSPAFTGVTVSAATKGSSANAGACYAKSTALTGKMNYSASSKSSSYYIDFPFTVNTGYTFTPCDVQVVIQPVSSNQAFTVEITNGTNVYGTSTATLNAGVMEPIIGLTSTAEMSAGNYAIRLYPHGGDNKEFRMGANVILKGTTAAAASDTYYLCSDFSGEWTETQEITPGSYVDVSLPEASYLKYKIKKVPSAGDATWYGRDGSADMERANCSNWTLSSSGPDCYVRTDIAGTYRFAMSLNGSGVPVMTVTYPTGVAVTLNMNGGGDPDTWQAYTDGVIPVPGYSPSRDGYAFDGWYADSDCTIPWVWSTTVSSATTLYAKWSNAWYFVGAADWEAYHLMTRSAGGSYWYYACEKGASNNVFFVHDATGDYGSCCTDAGYMCTDITDMNNSSDKWNQGDNAAIYENSSNYYVLVFPPYTAANTTSSPKICASTSLPEEYYSLPSGRTIYFDNSEAEWANIYFRKGRAKCAHNEATALTKVPGTDNLYKLTTAAVYDGYQAFHLANNRSWTGDNSIYKVNGEGYAITKATVFQKYTIDEDVTFTPGDADGDPSDGCQYYAVTKTSGMKRDRVTISKPSNGTITIHYTNVNGVSSSSTANVADMIEDLAHTVILTSITTSPNEGYDAGAITINGGAYSENYVVTGATTIAATFTPQVYSITYKDQDGAEFSGEHADGYPTTHTYGTATTLKTASKTGYTFGGWYGNSACTGAPMTSIGATSITAGIILYAKWTPAATLYTVTFDSNGGSTTPDAIEQASEDASITMPAAPTYSGYTFQGWVIGGTTYAAGASYTPTANVTAYASWKENCAGGGGGGSAITWDFTDLEAVAFTSNKSYSFTADDGETVMRYSAGSSDAIVAKELNKDETLKKAGYLKENGNTGSATVTDIDGKTNVGKTRLIRLFLTGTGTLNINCNGDNTGTYKVYNGSASGTLLRTFKADTACTRLTVTTSPLWIETTSKGYINTIVWTPASGRTCFYVTYNGNGAEAGSISDAEAYAASDEVTVSSNTGASAFTKSGYHVGSWNTAANGSGTTYALGATFNISADVTLYAQWVADACSAPSAPTISGTSVRTEGQTITLNAACATGADASTTYTWYKGVDWATAFAALPVQDALTAGEGGRIFNKASCASGDAGTYWCEASNGDGCEAHNATGFAVTVNAAVATHIYYYKDADHYDSETDTYYNPEGNTATLKDNQALSSPWTICNACMTGVDSVVAHGATYDGKGNWVNAYIKIPKDGTATTNNIKFALSAGYTGTLTMKIGGYENNPTVTLQPLNTSTGVLGSAITPTSGEVGGVATTEDNFNDIEWPLATAGGTYVLTVTSRTGYISQIDMTTETSAKFNVTYNGNGNTGGSEPTDDTDYASGATVTAAANSGTLVKTNYTGAGWNTANNGTGTNYVPGSGTFTITANTTLYAHWTQLITLAPGTQGTGTNNAAVSWNGSVLRGFAAHTTSGYALQGYYTEPSGGTKVLNADGSFAATNIDGFVTSGKWSNTGAAPTLYAQWKASSLLKWNLKVNVKESSITTLSKESAAPTVIAVANMGNLTNNGSLTITGDAKSALTSKIEAPTSYDANKYMSVQFVVAAGYQLRPSDINVKVQPVSAGCSAKLVLEDNNSVSMEKEQTGISKGSTVTVTMTNTSDKTFTGTVTLKIYVYGASTGTYRLGTPIEINGSVEATCATPPTFEGLSYDETEYTVGASASAITVTNPENADSYQWYYYTANDRSDATKITVSDATTASFTPSTASAFETRYYWCELTNTTCGITIKTPAVGITVRTATTDPTVTWSNVKLGATDDVTPNYGGGNYVLRATVNEIEWTGTLAASMITAPAGITIHDVTTGKADNKKYIEFQFDVTTAFDRASNATIDFNLALPEAGSYSALNSVKSVTYNNCSGGAAGQVAIKMGATASTSKSNPQNYWETAGAGRLMYNYGGNMGSTNNPSGYKTADSTFYYYAASTGQKWMFQTYIGGVNKVRVAFRAAGTIKSSKATITNFYYNTEYFGSPGSNAVSFGDVNANQAGYSSGEDGYIEFTVPEMAANSYGAFVTADGNMKVYGVVLYSENVGDGGSVATNPAWSDSKADGFTVEKNQSDANFGYTISTTTNTLGAITYSSSKPSVAAVDPVTGEVTITATGASAQSATITATLARSGCYQGATRTYKINVAGYSCSEPSGSVELTTGSATKCASESVTLTMTGFTEGASIQWYNGDSPISSGGGYTITTTATQSTLTTKAAGTYSAIATSSCDAKRTNSITIANLDMSEQKTVRKVSQWYVKNGRLTPDIALWQLGEGETFKSVAWSPSNTTGLDFVTRSGIVYLEGKEPSTNTSGADIPYTLTLTITDACGTDHVLSGQTIKLTHQKNTDKHVLAFVVNGTAKGGFTEGITAAQTTSVGLYNAIAAQFDVQATNIYSTDDEQKLREYYSQYDILCITDYPNTQTKGVNSKSYVDAIGALIDIRPILTMEAYVSSLANWKLKGVSGNPKSPTTRQYTMALQCKDHEIFNGVTTTKMGEGDEAMYRVTIVDKNQEEYKTLDANYGDGEHKSNEGYQYGKKPALQGFTYTEEMSENDLLPLGLIDDGAGNDLQVGIERQHEMSARLMVLGINSYAMERLTEDGKTIVINALKYLMKKNAEDISDCSVYFDGSDETDPTNWDNELNWGPSYASLPLPHQEVRILKECVVKDGVVARASGIKIIPSGRINHNTDDASGSLTIEPGGALIVDGKVRAALAPNYFNATPTTPANLTILASADAQGALILNNDEGETQATVQMYSPSYWEVQAGTNKKKSYWSYVAIPIQDAYVGEFFYGAVTYLYDETSGWIRKKIGSHFYAFDGIGLSLPEGHTETFYGSLAPTEEKDVTLTVSACGGENLIGNSWTAPIQIANFETTDFGTATPTVMIYSTGRDGTQDGERTDAVNVTATAENDGSVTAGQWVSIPIDVPSLDGYDGLKVIPAMQAFQVNTATETTLRLDYNKLVRDVDVSADNLTEKQHAPARRSSGAKKSLMSTMRVRVSGVKTRTDVWLLEDDRFSDEFDNGWEAKYVECDDRSAQLYAQSETGNMSFLAKPDIEGTVLGFAPSKDGNQYLFTFHYVGDDEYYLNDLKLKQSTLISDENSYLFTFEEGDTNRFYISRQPLGGPAITTGVENLDSQTPKAQKIIYNGKLYIIRGGSLYDATGKVVK